MAEIKEKFPDKTIWLYTGDLWENIMHYAIMQYVDVLVDGEFEIDKKDNKLLWKGSSNQRVIDVQKSLKLTDPSNRDDGRGMSEAELSRAVDPFYTTRTTRKYGFGVPFFKAASEMTGGSFEINSEEGKGTYIKAVFVLSHIDRMPLGNMTGTLISLINANCRIDFSYNYSVDEKRFSLDTRQLRAILGSVPLNIPISTAISP